MHVSPGEPALCPFAVLTHEAMVAAVAVAPVLVMVAVEPPPLPVPVLVAVPVARVPVPVDVVLLVALGFVAVLVAVLAVPVSVVVLGLVCVSEAVDVFAPVLFFVVVELPVSVLVTAEVSVLVTVELLPLVSVGPFGGAPSGGALVALQPVSPRARQSSIAKSGPKTGRQRFICTSPFRFREALGCRRRGGVASREVGCAARFPRGPQQSSTRTKYRQTARNWQPIPRKAPARCGA
jgi:hypothetical protein